MTEDGRLFDEWMGTAAKARADRVKRRVAEENNVAAILEAHKPEPTEFDDDLADMRAAEQDGPIRHIGDGFDLHRAALDLALNGETYFPIERPGR